MLKAHTINLPPTTIITNTTCCHGQVIRHFVPCITSTFTQCKKPIIPLILLD